MRGIHDRFGTFKVLLNYTDRLYNVNSTAFVGDNTFDFVRDWARQRPRLRRYGRVLAPSTVGHRPRFSTMYGASSR